MVLSLFANIVFCCNHKNSQCLLVCKDTSFSEYPQTGRGKVFQSFLFSLEKYHKKDGAGCIAIQKSLLTLTSSKILSLDNSKKTSFFLVLSSLNRTFAGRTIARWIRTTGCYTTTQNIKE